MPKTMIKDFNSLDESKNNLNKKLNVQNNVNLGCNSAFYNLFSFFVRLFLSLDFKIKRNIKRIKDN
jgi:hypothetical protein